MPLFLINTLLLYIPLLALTHRRNYGQRVKYTCFAWAGGTFFHFQLCCCVSFLVLAGNRLWFYILLMYLVVFVVTYALSEQYSCVAGKLILYEFSCWIRIFFSYIEVSQKYRHFLQPYSCNCFAKISRTFNSSRKLWIIVRRNISNSYVFYQKAL